MWNQNTGNLSCYPAHIRFLINYLTGSSDRNGQPNVSAYEYQNDTDLCQDNERENLARYGKPFSKTGRTEKADYKADISLFETNLSFSYKIYIFVFAIQSISIYEMATLYIAIQLRVCRGVFVRH